MIPDIIGGMSTAAVISVITDIIDLYDGTGSDFVSSPAMAVPKLNEIALVYDVAAINDVESGATAMIKINDIKIALETRVFTQTIMRDSRVMIDTLRMTDYG